jgi:O-antigen ligase
LGTLLRQAFRRGAEEAETSSLGRGWALLLSDIILFAILVSLGREVFRHQGTTQFLYRLMHAGNFSYGDPLYFVSAATIWIWGIAFFQQAAYGKQPAVGWIGAVVWAYAGVMIVFSLFQTATGIPEGWAAHYNHFLPFEDIQSYGGIAAALALFLAVRWHPRQSLGACLDGAGCLAMLGMVFVSYARSAWLAAVVGLMVLAWLRLPRRWCVAAVLALAVGLGLFRLNVDNPVWNQNAYLKRMGSLVAGGSFQHKDPVRFNLYEKAVAMIAERPFLGHGIGSFYLKSATYQFPVDPFTVICDPGWPARPNFAHDLFLQVAAELGLPCLGVFLALIAWGFLRGAGSNSAQASPFLEAKVALFAYIVSIAFNPSLNVYASNQFFFWLLLGTLHSVHRRPSDSPGRGVLPTCP